MHRNIINKINLNLLIFNKCFLQYYLQVHVELFQLSIAPHTVNQSEDIFVPKDHRFDTNNM